MATNGNTNQRRQHSVSIHATLAGGDRTSRRKRNRTKGSFYPRHPRGWRRVGQRQTPTRRAVSIHATLAGGDPLILWYVFAGRVSIHATLAGGDRCASNVRILQQRFLSTPPSRVATCQTAWPGCLPGCFYPRHPRGWRQMPFGYIGIAWFVSIHATLAGGDNGRTQYNKPKNCFYPRHPRGWRRRDFCVDYHVERVSIHATLAGGDLASLRPLSQANVFLSTPPSRVATQDRPKNPFAPGVSIHATLAGGDVSPAAAPSRLSTFLSTPPSRVATFVLSGVKKRYYVSIHATLAGGDLCCGRLCKRHQRFYPRHPRGWRRGFNSFAALHD